MKHPSATPLELRAEMVTLLQKSAGIRATWQDHPGNMTAAELRKFRDEINFRLAQLIVGADLTRVENEEI